MFATGVSAANVVLAAIAGSGGEEGDERHGWPARRGVRPRHEGRDHERRRLPGRDPRIATDYRFRNLGGASAGAIAAVAAAACEYRWNQGDPAAYDVLDEVQTRSAGRASCSACFSRRRTRSPAFDVALRFVTSKGSLARQAPAAVISILRRTQAASSRPPRWPCSRGSRSSCPRGVGARGRRAERAGLARDRSCSASRPSVAVPAVLHSPLVALRPLRDEP